MRLFGITLVACGCFGPLGLAQNLTKGPIFAHSNVCSVPLLEVPLSPTETPIARLPDAATSPMPRVQGPAPSCSTREPRTFAFAAPGSKVLESRDPSSGLAPRDSSQEALPRENLKPIPEFRLRAKPLRPRRIP